MDVFNSLTFSLQVGLFLRTSERGIGDFALRVILIEGIIIGNTPMNTTPSDPLEMFHFNQMVCNISASGIMDLAKSAKEVGGFLTDNEGAILFNLARFGMGKGHIVEIGSFKGKSTIWLALGSKSADREKVFAIDPHVGSEEHQKGERFESKMPESGSTFDTFIENIRTFQVDNWVEPLVKTSVEAAKAWPGAPIRLLFIDGDHSFEGAELDFLSWEPFVIPGGLIVFHDVPPTGAKGAPFPGPSLVIERHIDNNPRFQKCFHVDGTMTVAKISAT